MVETGQSALIGQRPGFGFNIIPDDIQFFTAALLYSDDSIMTSQFCAGWVIQVTMVPTSYCCARPCAHDLIKVNAASRAFFRNTIPDKFPQLLAFRRKTVRQFADFFSIAVAFNHLTNLLLRAFYIHALTEHHAKAGSCTVVGTGQHQIA